MAGDWIKIHRSMLESPIFQHDGLFRLWSYCLLRANWKPRKWLIPGTLKEIEIARGAFITGRESLHASLYPKVDRDGNIIKHEHIPVSTTVWRWLKSLEAMGCVSLEVHSKCTVVTVVKYSTYQDIDESDAPIVPRSCPDLAPTVRTIEEGKKERKKEENKEPPAPRGRNLTASDLVTADSLEYPEGFDTPEVRQAVDQWLTYQKTRGQSYKTTATAQRIWNVADWKSIGPDGFIAAVNRSIGNNYQGLFPPKDLPKAAIQPKPTGAAAEFFSTP